MTQKTKQPKTKEEIIEQIKPLLKSIKSLKRAFLLVMSGGRLQKQPEVKCPRCTHPVHKFDVMNGGVYTKSC